MTSTVISGPNGPVEAHVHGEGHPVVMLSSLGRGATDFDDLALLLACGGLVPAGPEATAALFAVFDVELGDEQHLEAVRAAFFAPGNDPAVWFDGWHGIVAAVQSKADNETDTDEWWMAGDADVLVVQPEQDVVAVPENAARIAEQFGERATVLSLSNAGHAMLPEQPEEVANLLLNWLDLRLS